MIDVLIGQKHPIVGGALAALLSAEPDLRVVATVDDGDDVPDAAGAAAAQVAILDACLPGSACVAELCRTLRRQVPDCRPLVLADPGAPADLGRSLLPQTPWLGVLATDAPPHDLVMAVRWLARGRRVLDRRFTDAASTAGSNPLTGRERDILRLTRYGAPPKEIARKLGLSVGTVRNYLSRTLAKIGARTRLEATTIAQDAGWI